MSKTWATRWGVTFADWQEKRLQGLYYCMQCRTWKLAKEFGKNGTAVRPPCLSCKPRRRFFGPAIDRLFAKVRWQAGCWEFTGSTDEKGYGQINVASSQGRRPAKAHRIAYEHLVGPLPEGWHIDHLCRNPPCVNPLHLEAVTPTENTLRGNTFGMGAPRRNITHCPKGHVYDEQNTSTCNGKRSCKLCRKIARQVGVAPTE